jgi:hypothetical protein
MPSNEYFYVIVTTYVDAGESPLVKNERNDSHGAICISVGQTFNAAKHEYRRASVRNPASGS